MSVKKDATVFILFGQSNASGHETPMRKEDIIEKGLKNVYGLRRENHYKFDNTCLKWENYTSYGMNLGEDYPNSYSVANILASLWQNAVDSGKNLPDLYIIQMARGAHGVTPAYMWFPEYERVIDYMPEGWTKVALFPYSLNILSLVDKSFKQMGKSYEIMGLHWRGGENDMTEKTEYLKENLENIYKTLFGGFKDALKADFPVILHLMPCFDRANDMDPTGEFYKRLEYINEIFFKLERENDDISTFDITKAPFFNPYVRGNGLYVEDVVHYTEQSNKWVAQKIFDSYTAKF